MELIDLYAGIGVFSYCAKQVWGDYLKILGFSEIDDYCIKVYQQHNPGVPHLGRAEDVNGKAIKFSGPSIVTGGFPCPPFSYAGNRRGKKADSYEWDSMLRIIVETRPNWVIAENVTGLLTLGIEESISDLEGKGYETGVFVLPACGVDAPHRRERVFIIANTKRKSISRSRNVNESEFTFANTNQTEQTWKWLAEKQTGQDLLNPSWPNYWETEPPVFGMDDGATDKLHRTKRIEVLGNAVVAPLVCVLMDAIKNIQDLIDVEANPNT